VWLSRNLEPLNGEDENEAYQIFNSSVATSIANRRFFQTTKGYVGLGPIGMQKGDEVYVINGSNVPFVLRKVEQYSLRTSTVAEEHVVPNPTFHLVRDCYVHGIMNGEACDGSGWGKAGSLVLC